MSQTSDLSAPTVRKLRTLIRQGEEHLDAINAALKRAETMAAGAAPGRTKAAQAANVDKLRHQVAFVFDEAEHGTLMKATKWTKRVDDFAVGYLDDKLARRVVRHGKDFGGKDHLEVIEKLTGAVLGRLDTLRAIVGTAAPTPAGPDRDSDGGWRHIRDLGLVESSVIDGYLKAFRARSTVAERRAAIGAAKELLEATLKGALRYTASASAEVDKAELPALWKSVVTQLQLDDASDAALGGRDIGVIKILNGLNTAVAGTAEVRNKVGTGHGRAAAPKGLKDSHVVLVIDATFTLTRFVTARLAELHR